jgi:hypothetical protein
MAEYSRLAKGKFTSTGGAQIINLPFRPGYVEFLNYTAYNTAATSQNVLSGKWYSEMGQGFAAIEGYNASPALIGDTVTVGGISTFQGGLALQYGPVLQISGITKAAAGVVTTTTNHNLTSGDVVLMNGLYQSTTTGMPQIAGIPFTVTVLSATTFSIPWNTNQSNYTALSGSPAGSTLRKILYPYLYFPGTTVISAITAPNGTTIPTGTVLVDTTDAHNFTVGQEVAFRIPQIWGSVELNSLPDLLIPGSPIYGYVDSVTDYNTVIVRIPASAAFTAFNSNPAVTSVNGLSFPQIVAVGDVNTGGVQISSGSVLYPPPYSQPIGTTKVNTINGPAIQGAYVNNTSQGFIIGAGSGTVLTTASLVGANGNVIYWRAIDSDIVVDLP